MMTKWLQQFPPSVRETIRELSVPKRNPITRKERRAAERAERKRREKARKLNNRGAND
jgi:hypothetical protein